MMTVIYISKDKLTGVKVDGGKQALYDRIELGWDTNTFDICLSKIVEKLQSQKMRVLLDNSLSYTLRLSIPPGLNETDERRLIAEKIREKIPEVLRDEDWDFREIQFNLTGKSKPIDGKEREIIVFSPVKYVTELLRKSKINLNLDIEAIEPVEIAQTRNANPIIGIALKDDMKGKDKDVLNINLSESKKEEDFKDVINTKAPVEPATSGEAYSQGSKEMAEVEDNEAPSVKKVILTAFLILLIASFLSIFGYMVYRNFFAPKSEKTDATSEVSPTETIEPTITQQPTPEVLDLTTYKINIKNGSGVAGEAQNVVAILESEGFTQFDTGNADSYNYGDTQVITKTDFPGLLIEQIVGALSDDYNVSSPSSTLSGSDYDVEITVGARSEQSASDAR